MWLFHDSHCHWITQPRGGQWQVFPGKHLMTDTGLVNVAQPLLFGELHDNVKLRIICPLWLPQDQRTEDTRAQPDGRTAL